MPTVKVRDIVRDVETILQDYNLRWPRIETQSWINKAYQAISNERPDAHVKVGTFTCTANDTRQDLASVFATGLTVVDVTRNLGATSNKRAITVLNKKQLDDQRPLWHAQQTTVNIEHFCYDPRDPKGFFVYPPPATGAAVEIVYSEVPAGHTLTEAELDPDTGSAEVIRIDDTYVPAIIAYVLAKSYDKDQDYAENAERSIRAMNEFATLMSKKTATDLAIAPKASGNNA